MKSKITHALLKEAIAYADFSIKEGYSSESDWENLTDEEFITKAVHESDKADDYMDSIVNEGRD